MMRWKRQFTLKSLMVAVAICAVLCWLAFRVWPEFRERTIERALVSATIDDQEPAWWWPSSWSAEYRKRLDRAVHDGWQQFLEDPAFLTEADDRPGGRIVRETILRAASSERQRFEAATRRSLIGAWDMFGLYGAEIEADRLVFHVDGTVVKQHDGRVTMKGTWEIKDFKLKETTVRIVDGSKTEDLVLMFDDNDHFLIKSQRPPFIGASRRK
jgi:hypothetical protein